MLNAGQLKPSGFLESVAKLNPFEVWRQYLCDRHERKKDDRYREKAEARTLELTNDRIKLELIKEAVNVVKDAGGSQEELLRLRMQALQLFDSNPVESANTCCPFQVSAPRKLTLAALLKRILLLRMKQP